jgi:hypothetical protein
MKQQRKKNIAEQRSLSVQSLDVVRQSAKPPALISPIEELIELLVDAVLAEHAVETNHEDDT